MHKKCRKCGNANLLTIGDQQACEAESCDWHTPGFENLRPPFLEAPAEQVAEWRRLFIAGLGDSYQWLRVAEVQAKFRRDESSVATAHVTTQSPARKQKEKRQRDEARQKLRIAADRWIHDRITRGVEFSAKEVRAELNVDDGQLSDVEISRIKKRIEGQLQKPA